MVSGTDTSVPLNAVTSRMALRFCKAPGIDDLGEVTVGRPKLERFRIGRGKNCTSALCDLVREGLAVRHLYAPMMNARAGSGQLRLLGIFAVVDHQRQMKLRSGRRSFNAHSSPSIFWTALRPNASGKIRIQSVREIMGGLGLSK
jgi:hypothetical protein